MVRFCVVLAALLLFGSAAEAAAPSYVWTELAGDTQSVRAIVAEAACPALTVDGKTVAMQPRLAANASFSGTTCEARLPFSAKEAALAGQPIALLKKSVQRIVVIGDTGCRLKKKFVQGCNDPAAWPFAAVAQHAADAHPDLIIHVGDYLYRETPCPEGNTACAGSPHGDNWPTWNADLFTPARPLLGVAPWIFVRGNHEQCGRSAGGWFRFLDAGRTPLICPATATPFTVALDGLKLMVLDSADNDDYKAPPDKVAHFRNLFASLDGQLASGHGWVITHRPIWGFMPKTPGDGDDDEKDELPVNRTEQEAARGIPLNAIDLVLSGHIHVFADVSFGPQRPAQLIVGDGGDMRNGKPGMMMSQAITIDDLPAKAFMASRFGYFVLDRMKDPPEDRWAGTLHDADGGVIATCTIAPRDIACQPV